MILTYESVSAFLEDSCSALKIALSPTEHSWHGYVIDRYSSGYRIMSPTRPDFDTYLVALNIKDEIPFLKRYALLLQNDTRYIHIKEKVGGADSLGHWLHPNSLLLTLLSDYLKEVTSIEFSKPIADMLAKRFLDSLSSEMTSYCVFSPIKGLAGLSSPVNVEPDFQLRQLSDIEICSLMEDYKQDPLSPDFPDSTCVAEFEVSVPVWQGIGNTSKEKQAFNNIVNSLRILKDTDVVSNSIYTRRKYRGAIRFGYGGGWSADHGWRACSPKYVCTIEEDEVDHLLRYYRCLAESTLPPKLKRSLHRFNFAVERDLPEDMLVDSLISLEALFGDGNGAIGYKIALRASVFLEFEFSARRSIFDSINASYNQRSALVHGKSSNQLGHVGQLTSLARRSIRKSMELFIHDNRIPSTQDFDDLLLM